MINLPFYNPSDNITVEEGVFPIFHIEAFWEIFIVTMLESRDVFQRYKAILTSLIALYQNTVKNMSASCDMGFKLIRGKSNLLELYDIDIVNHEIL